MRSAIIRDACAVLAGVADKPHLVVLAAIVAAAWIAMDVVQFTDFVLGKLSSGAELPL